MRILLLLPYAWDTAPSQRYRIEQWVPWLKDWGVEFRVLTMLTKDDQALLYGNCTSARKGWVLARRTLRRLLELGTFRDVDAVWLHRAACPVGPPLMELLIKSLGIPLIFEFDDAIFLADTAQSNRRWQRLKWPQKTPRICRLADHVVVGNDYLGGYAGRYNPEVTVIPTTVDTAAYRPKTGYETDLPVVLGWSGSVTTLVHLRLLDRVFQRVAARLPVRVHVIGAPGYDLAGVETRFIPWCPERQVEELSRFDVGVMPLPDEEWAKGKCACKALEYMAVGVPTVASPVGVNGQVIQNGRNGLLASTEDEWVEALCALAGDPDLRARLGRAGRVTVAESYSATAQVPRVLDVLRRVVVRKPGVPRLSKAYSEDPCVSASRSHDV